jgi:glycogen operon protein
MLLAGDEIGHTQSGNNNVYCQDNETAWLDWSRLERNADLLRFVRRLIDLRGSRLWLRRDTFLKGSLRGARAKDVTWLHPSGREMTEADWNESSLRAIAVHMDGAPSRASDSGDLLVVCNADHAHVDLTLPPPPPGAAWRVLFDTSDATAAEQTAPYAGGRVLRVEQRSTVLLESVASQDTVHA